MSVNLDKDVRFQFLRGTTGQNDLYKGRLGEFTLDMDGRTIRMHDGNNPGGHVVGMSVVDKFSGSSIQLNFKTYMAYEVNLSGTANISFTGRQNNILNEMLVNIKGLDNTSVVWPTTLRWLRPDGNFVANPANMGFDFTDSDWIVFWTHTETGVIYAKIMR